MIEKHILTKIQFIHKLIKKVVNLMNLNEDININSFVAYKGKEIRFEKIYQALSKECPNGYKIDIQIFGDVVFAKVIRDDCYIYDREPYYEDGVLAVGSYDLDELIFINKKYSQGDLEQPYKIINAIYKNSSNSIFEELKSSIHFCAAIWDVNKKVLMAGVTEPDDENTTLYCVYTREKNEVVFSNNKNVLGRLCDERTIMKMKDNTYMENGIIYSLENSKKQVLK